MKKKFFIFFVLLFLTTSSIWSFAYSKSFFTATSAMNLQKNQIFSTSKVIESSAPENRENSNSGIICKTAEQEIVSDSGVTVIILQPNNSYMTVNDTQREIDPGRGTKPVIIPNLSNFLMFPHIFL